MWLSRPKSSTARVRTAPSTFSCSSFKDIQHLCAADDSNNPAKPKAAAASDAPRASIFHRVRLANSLLRAWSTHLPPARDPPKLNAAPPPAEPAAVSSPCTAAEPERPPDRIVVYFTSLRVVRSTFEDCRAVRSILRGFRVAIDERDVSMDNKFTEEINAILPNQIKGNNKVSLPRVFIGGKYIGGADEIRQLHEAGELKKFVEGLPAAEADACEVCGGYRFILCDECSGSHKCYAEKTGFRTCTKCNENGLIRCPSCLCGPL